MPTFASFILADQCSYTAGRPINHVFRREPVFRLTPKPDHFLDLRNRRLGDPSILVTCVTTVSISRLHRPSSRRRGGGSQSQASGMTLSAGQMRRRICIGLSTVMVVAACFSAVVHHGRESSSVGLSEAGKAEARRAAMGIKAMKVSLAGKQRRRQANVPAVATLPPTDPLAPPGVPRAMAAFWPLVLCKKKHAARQRVALASYSDFRRSTHAASKTALAHSHPIPFSM
jgi:hypothetical protein